MHKYISDSLCNIFSKKVLTNTEKGGIIISETRGTNPERKEVLTMTIRNEIMKNKALSAKQRKAALIALTRMVCGEGRVHTATTRYDQKDGDYFVTDYACREVKSGGITLRLSRVRMTDHPVQRPYTHSISINVEDNGKEIVILY